MTRRRESRWDADGERGEEEKNSGAKEREKKRSQIVVWREDFGGGGTVG